MSKLQADGLKKISVIFLKQQGYLPRGWSGTITWTSPYSGFAGSADIEVSTNGDFKYLRIQHTEKDSTGPEEKYDYKIALTTTPCRYGGQRYWFMCPLYCGRRVGTLYMIGGLFACRHCYRLSYNSRNESRKYRRFVSVPDLERQDAKVKHPYYRGQVTKKYARYLEMQERFYQQAPWARSV